MINPYVYDRPIAQRERFYGRRSEIMRIYSRIAADRPQSVSIVGEPRTGKTSLLNWLYDAAARAEYLDEVSEYVYLLLRLNEAAPDRPEAFFAQVNEALRETGRDAIEPTYSGFSSLVERLMGGDEKLVLFCDDFHVVTQNPAFPLDFFSFLRSVANNNDVGYITTSSAALQKLCASQDLEESPFFNIFTTVNLGPLKEEEAQNLVQQPALVAGAPFAEEANWILELGGMSPYLLQLSAGLAFEARSDGALTRERLADEAFKEARDFLHLLWEGHFSAAQQEVMQSVSTDKKVERRLRYAADDLERRGYLRKAGDGYGFRPDLLRRFVLESGRRRVWKRLFG